LVLAFEWELNFSTAAVGTTATVWFVAKEALSRGVRITVVVVLLAVAVTAAVDGRLFSAAAATASFFFTA
jgi:hypothetical protein